MKTFMKILILFFAALPLNIAIANDDIAGLWQGTLVIGPDTELVIQFNISQDASGSYTAVLNTPDGGTVENVKADSVDFNAGNLKISVAELSGSYEGIFKEGKINGEWKQEGTSFPLSLKPYEKPTLSKEDMDMLLGTWHGQPVLPEGAIIQGNVPTFLFRFEMSEQGEFTGTFTTTDMGPQEPISNIGISDGIFTFKIDNSQKFEGKLTDGKIVGEINLINIPDAMGLSITLVKGEYKAPVYNLNLPKEIKEQLSGKWNGMLKMQAMQTISMVVEFSFETSENGDFSGFADTPEEGGSELRIKSSRMQIDGAPMKGGIQFEKKISGNGNSSVFVDTPEGGGSGLPITDANMIDGKLFLAVKALGGEFTGEILADKLVGDWTQTGGGSTPITLNRGGYVSPE